MTPTFSHDSCVTPFVWEHGGRSEVGISTWKTLTGFDLVTGELKWQHPHAMQQMVPSLVAGDDWLLTRGGNALPYQMAAVRPTAGTQLGPTLWTSKRGTPAISSPVCRNGLLFSVSSTSILFCRDVITGEEHWSQRLEGKFLASLVAGDDRVGALNTDGAMFVVAANSEGSQSVVNRLGEPCSASPALANGSLFARGVRHLFCIGGCD